MKTNRNIFSRQILFSNNAMLMYLAFMNFLLLMGATLIGKHWGGYGYLWDEFYFIACAKRLAFGYVDHPPLSLFLLRLVLLTLGDSLLALRVLPALAGSLTVVVTGLIARQLGAGRFGQCVAALALVTSVFLSQCSFFSMNAFEPLIWTTCGYIVILLIQRENPRLWLFIGVLIGIGLMNKQTLSPYVLSLYIGLLFTPARKYLLSKWLWFGVGLTGLLILPNLIWQLQHGFPSLEFYRNAMIEKNVTTPPISVLLQQMVTTNPFRVPVWLSGLYMYLFSKQGKPYRLFGWSYLILLAMMMASHSSRSDRLCAAYPLLFAAGAVLIDQAVKRYRSRVLPISIITILIISGIISLPTSLPILPPRKTIDYFQMLGESPGDEEKGYQGQLPQGYAYRLEWENLIMMVANVYNSLSPEEQAKCVIYADGRYGVAGALEFFGQQYDLPPVISNHNNYYLWGPGEATDEVMIFLSEYTSAELQQNFGEVNEAKLAARVTCEYCALRDLRIHICKGSQQPLKDVWPGYKHYE
jgi:hypothetical protein